jgi:hypothetical protein
MLPAGTLFMKGSHQYSVKVEKISKTSRYKIPPHGKYTWTIRNIEGKAPGRNRPQE